VEKTIPGTVTSSVSSILRYGTVSFRCLVNRLIFSVFFGLGSLSGFSVSPRFFYRVHPKGGESRYREQDVSQKPNAQSLYTDAQAQDKTKNKQNNFSPFFLFNTAYIGGDLTYEKASP